MWPKGGVCCDGSGFAVAVGDYAAAPTHLTVKSAPAGKHTRLSFTTNLTEKLKHENNQHDR